MACNLGHKIASNAQVTRFRHNENPLKFALQTHHPVVGSITGRYVPETYGEEPAKGRELTQLLSWVKHSSYSEEKWTNGR